MFEMGAETMRLPLAEKMQYEQGDEGISFGYVAPHRYHFVNTHTHFKFLSARRYKAAGANATDETGALDTVEFINVAKDDALAWPRRVHRAYPPTVEARMERTIAPFVRKSLAVNTTLLEILNDRLGLPPGALARRHATDEPSGSEARTIKNPPRPGGMSEAQAAIGAHTDFGSLVSGWSIARSHARTSLIPCDSRSYTIASEACRSWSRARPNGNTSRRVCWRGALLR